MPIFSQCNVNYGKILDKEYLSKEYQDWGILWWVRSV
jgi:hypothetical protein